jgi:hypothetical protein
MGAQRGRPLGQLARVSAWAFTLGGDVVHTVVVALEEQPEGLRLGMTVEVEITTELGVALPLLDVPHVSRSRRGLKPGGPLRVP